MTTNPTMDSFLEDIKQCVRKNQNIYSEKWRILNGSLMRFSMNPNITDFHSANYTDEVPNRKKLLSLALISHATLQECVELFMAYGYFFPYSAEEQAIYELLEYRENY